VLAGGLVAGIIPNYFALGMTVFISLLIAAFTVLVIDAVCIVFCPVLLCHVLFYPVLSCAALFR
jgi:hypothetical protein